jgi:outer membrane lipoprotein carrier protein
MRLLLHVTLSAVITATASSSAAAQDADALIARAQAAWSRINTLRGTFEQTVTNPLTGSALTARGELQQKKPDRLAITFTDPAGDRIVADGRYVWLYLPSAAPGQVIRLRSADLAAANTDLLGQFLETPRAKYDVTDLGSDKLGDRDNRVLVLMAKPGQVLPFIRAKVWIDATDALIRQFEATDANGVSRRVRLLTMSSNAPVDASAFAFSVPAGVRIVEH